MIKLIIVCGCFLLCSCSSWNNDCAKKGAAWGYIYGTLKSGNSLTANMYSVAGRIHTSKYCD